MQTPSELPSEFLIIDEQGIPRSSEAAFPPDVSAEILRQLRVADNGAFITDVAGQKALVEAFDEPLVVKNIAAPTSADKAGENPAVKTSEKAWILELPFQVQKHFHLKSLSFDEWDRFHGVTTEGVPFVLSAQAQDQLFNAVDEFDDNSVTYLGQEFELSEWLAPVKEVETSAYWSQIYQTEIPRWDLGEPSPIFKDLLPRLKISKARVLVLGSGPGHDAAYFAQQGHVVTAVDISADAIAKAKSNYPNLQNITWVEADIFRLPQDWQGQFDLVVEHTCYCAINPSRRNELVKTWLRLLAPQGYLLGAFFAMEKRQGPPFGGSEWEIRQRLKSRFHFVFWGRWRQSLHRRNGKELAVYAQKKSLNE